MSVVPDALFHRGGVPVDSLSALDMGNVYWVIQTTHPRYATFMRDRQGMYENDKTEIVYPTITLALAATVTERNDYVVVIPDNDDYDEGATLTLDKAHVHLICPSGLGSAFGCSTRSATIDPAAAANAITITGRGVEVAGFWIRGKTEKLCVTNSGTGAWIHHNNCAVTNTTSVAGGIYSSGIGTTIERNFIFSNAGSGTWLYGIAAIGGATRTHVMGNVITVGNASTCSAGINMAYDNSYMQMGVCADNYILEIANAGGGVGAATVTIGIKTGVGTLVTNNRIGITDISNAISGGGALNCIGNYSSLDGGTITV